MTPSARFLVFSTRCTVSESGCSFIWSGGYSTVTLNKLAEVSHEESCRDGYPYVFKSELDGSRCVCSGLRKMRLHSPPVPARVQALLHSRDGKGSFQERRRP